jgi:hypothetical protein
MVVKDGEKTMLIRFNSIQGKEITEKFPVGKSVTGISKGRLKRFDAVTPSKMKSELNDFFQFFLADSLVSAKSDDLEIKSNWDSTKKNKSVLSASREDTYVLFDQEVVQVIELSKKYDIDINSTWTCYFPTSSKERCGKCYSCIGLDNAKN